MPVRGALPEDARAALPANVRERVTRPDVSVPGNTVELAVVAPASGLAAVIREGTAGVELTV